MNGLREQFEIEEHAQSIQHQIDKPIEDIDELKKLLKEMHEIEEERRTAAHSNPEA
jgi:uncharacterized coiled-coil DUF342 family protein